LQSGSHFGKKVIIGSSLVKQRKWNAFTEEGRKVIDKGQDTITNESLQLEGLANSEANTRYTTTHRKFKERNHTGIDSRRWVAMKNNLN